MTMDFNAILNQYMTAGNAITSILCFLIFVILVHWNRRPRNLPPGPWGWWPILGSFPNLIYTAWRTGNTKPHELLWYLADQYGDICSMYLGNKLVVVLNTHDAIREAFRNPDIAGRPENAIAAKLKRGHGIVTGSGAPWHQQRKFTLTTFNSFGIGKSSFQDKIAEEAHALALEFDKLQDQPFDLQTFFNNATCNVISAVVFGQRFDYNDEKLKRLLWIMNRQMELMGSGLVQIFIPAFRYFQSNIYQEMVKLVAEQRAFIMDILSNHKKTFDPDNLRDYLDVYLNEMQQDRGAASSTSELNESNLDSTLTQIFIAGTETTGTTLRWIVLYLVVNPDIQSKIQKEIDDVVGRNRLPRLSDKSQMPFTQAAIHEGQRIATIAVLGLPHQTIRDTRVKGFAVPQGSIVVPNMFKVDHDSSAWDEPWTFKAERFIDAKGDFRPLENVMPFSVGRRSCLGENLAKMELFIFVTHLLHQFTFKKPDNEVLSLEGRISSTFAPAPYRVWAVRRD